MAIRTVAKSLAGRIRAAGDRLFEKDDAVARENGWTIEVRRGGLGRTYRDPRFDRLSRCPDCGGTGSGGSGNGELGGSGSEELGMPCGRCSGEGRVTLGGQLSLAGR